MTVDREALHNAVELLLDIKADRGAAREAVVREVIRKNLPASAISRRSSALKSIVALAEENFDAAMAILDKSAAKRQQILAQRNDGVVRARREVWQKRIGSYRERQRLVYTLAELKAGRELTDAEKAEAYKVHSEQRKAEYRQFLLENKDLGYKYGSHVFTEQLLERLRNEVAQAIAERKRQSTPMSEWAKAQAIIDKR